MAYSKTNKYGTTYWFHDNGKLGRSDGPAVEYVNGSKEWLVNGEFHREDGPAIEGVDGYKEWWINGKRHRIGGPAVEWSDGSQFWCLDGEEYTEEEYKQLIKKCR